MNRREALTALGVSAAGLTALTGGQARSAEEHKHGEHFDTCAKACADCQVACDGCFRHCADLVARGNKGHVKTMHTCVDCAECCKLAASLSARQSQMARHACECCAKCCEECATACEKFQADKHMAACAKACRDCAKACREMLKHLAG